MMIKTPVRHHVLRKEERLLQSLSHQAGMPPAIMPKHGIKRNGIPSTSNTGDQVRGDRRTWATGASSRLSTELDLLLLWS